MKVGGPGRRQENRRFPIGGKEVVGPGRGQSGRSGVGQPLQG